MQNLEPIVIFLTVAEMGSFTRAADSLGIQKGRASTAVRKLEEDVGVRLLHRTTRSVQLTEDGRAFHARARDLCRREKLNCPIRHQSDNDKPAHYPAGPQGAIQSRGFRHLI